MKAEIGIIGGTGFYQFLKGREVEIKTPYGRPSDKILISQYKGQKIAFLPRHGKKHQYPPSKINYQANLYALKKLGCQRIIAPAAAGSLKPKIKPGDFVICDQFIDRTKNRTDTFFGEHSKPVVHVSMAEPYCPELRKLAIQTCRKLQIPVHPTGTVIVIEGPRFSTKAESNFYSKMGWDVINMTQYPEVVLARELEMCYLNICLITDYDVKSVTAAEVIKVFKENNKKVQKVILEMIKKIPDQRKCFCGQALKEARL